jgi:hypothetical protein
METKICSRCNIEKPIDCFAWKNKALNKKSAECKECHRIIRKSYYFRNKRKEINRILTRKKEIKQWYNDFKKTLVCNRCPENHPATLQFHHKDPTTKLGNLSELSSSGWSIKKIMEEMDKCEILCSNCHFKLHWGDYK